MKQQPHLGGEAELPTPEQHEQLQINSIVIPVEDDLPLRQQQLAVSDLDSYQRLVGGHLEVVTLDAPPASLYLNEEGKLLGLPVNGRATMLLWAHSKRFRFQDYIAGDAFLVGLVDDHGDDTSISDDYVRQLIEAQRFRVEVQTYGDAQWYGNELRFNSWTAAYGYALDLGRRWTQVEDLRILPEQTTTA